MRKLVCLGLTILTVIALPAMAKPVHKTKYKFYNITGDSPREIYDSMLKRGPNVNGISAYASTSVSYLPDGRTIQTGKSCRVDSYNVKMDFTINLPKLKNEPALTGQTSAKWNQFESFMKVHEDTHRRIWLDCTQSLVTQIKTLKGKSCRGIESQVAKLWKKMRKSCDAKQAAFDAAEQIRLAKHPFLKLVLGQRVTLTKALKVKTP